MREGHRPAKPLVRPAVAGAVAALIALGLTELAAGVLSSVPSALSSIGAVIVDRSPSWLEDLAISTLGTADKGALAMGTVVVVLIVGAVTGRAAERRFWVAVAAFSAAGVLGIATMVGWPGSSPVASTLAVGFAVAAGLWLLWLMLRVWVEAGDVDWDRRRVLAATGALAAAGILSLAVGRWLIIRRAEATRFATALPDPVIRVLPPEPDQSLEIADLTPIIVEDGDFYRIDTALIVPIVDPVGWRLKVTGLVETELALELDDLFELPQHERYVTIACVSNDVGGDLVGNARWQGVRLTEILSMAGVRREATQIVGRSVDGWTSGFPTEAAFDGREPLVVFGMNGEVLPRRHGYPARLIVPGLYGYVSATKWLEEIEMTTWEDFDAYWIPRGWAKEGPIKTQSRIDRPRSGSLVEAGPLVAAGVAWAPTRGITVVEIQIDDGPWLGADVTRPLSQDAWVQWSVEVEVEAGEHDLRVRATDGTGETQTGENRGPRPSGATGWHRVSFAAR